MGRVVSVKVPVWAAPAGTEIDVKNVLAGAAVLRLSPLFEGLDGTGVIERIRLDQVADDYLSHLERIHEGVAKGRICAGLIAAYYRRPEFAAKGPDSLGGVERLTEALGHKVRTSQIRLYSEIAATLELGRIGFHEASTGTGKTLAIVASAVDRARAGETVVIAVPTLGLVETVDADMKRLLAAGVDLPKWQVVYGRREFVSRAAAEARLSEDFSAELEKLVTDAVQTGDWRMATWQKAAPHVIGLSTCVVSELTPKDDPGLRAYKAQFERGRAPIIVCTHAMLAIDAVLRRMRIGSEEEFKEGLARRLDEEREREGAKDGFDYRIANMVRAEYERDEHRHLPGYTVAFVDEAHLLEQAFANVMAVDLSLWQLLRALRSLRERNPTAVPKDALAAVGKAFERLKPKKDEDADSRMIGNDADEAREFDKVRKALTAVKETLKHCNKEPEAQQFVGRARTALQAFFADDRAVAILSFSPSKRFPRLLMGRQTTHREMHFLWTSMRAAALVSATLNVVTTTGEASAASMRYLLNVPVDRARMLAPIVNREIYRPVTCLTPSPERAREGYLVRPAGDDDGDYGRWVDEIAGVLRRMAAGAVGGSLVLTTSYRMIEALKERLEDELDGRLIVSVQGRRLVELADEFLDAAVAGKRPVWIATGAAWTGLDLSGSRRGILRPADDNLLTELAITNVPFRTNRSLSHESRIKRGGNFETVDTYIKMKQGLGRLVRNPSPSLPANRRLWFLDGRIYEIRSRARMAIFAGLLNPYERKDHFA